MFPLGDIAETHRVSYAMKRDGKIYMLVTHWLTDDKAVVPLKNQKLLVMDPETFEWEVVRDMKESERIVGWMNGGLCIWPMAGYGKPNGKEKPLAGKRGSAMLPKISIKRNIPSIMRGTGCLCIKSMEGSRRGILR